MRRSIVRRHARASQHGFTLPELMVSLVAGLIVTLAVVGLARTATKTFHEQVRSSASQMALRLAGQRLAGDLVRAGYMSTGNIRWDPTIQRAASNPGGTGSRYTPLDNMAGLRLYFVGATENPALTLETDNALRPEALDITGNFTSNDQYLGFIPDDGQGTCINTIELSPNDPAVLKLTNALLPDGTTPARSDADATTLIRGVFIPVAGKRFIARITDPAGKNHFVIVTDAAVNGAKATVTLANPTAGGCPVLTGGTTQAKAAFGGLTKVQIAPIQTVRWNIRRLASARLDPPEDAAMKFDLIRQYVDADNALVGTPEVVVEYAIDLKFAFTVDQSPAIPNLTSFDFETEAPNGLWAAQTTTGVAASSRVAGSDAAPHRIRSVRFRISDRAARPDRDFDMPGQPAGYPLRYCLDGAPSLTCLRYSRVRTFVSEVALINQARMKSIADPPLPPY